MKNAGSTMVAIVLGVAGLLAASALAPAHAEVKTKMQLKSAAKPKAKAPAPAASPAGDHCALDDLGFDSMVAKKSDAPAAPAAKKVGSSVDSIAESRAAADKFDLGRKSRDATRPSGDSEVKMEAKTLSVSAVGAVVAERESDLEYCFMKIPEADRATEQFSLHLSISSKGTVSAATVEGDADAAKIASCVEAQVKRWSFPQTDAPTEVDYPLSFHVAD